MLLGMRQGPFGDPSPVINWDFLQSQSLTSFSRTSNATLFDSTGQLTYAANNLALYSEDFDQTAWKNNTTTANLIVTPNDALSPIGTQTADKVVTSSTSGAVRLRQNITPILKSTKIVFSVWVKSDSIGYFRVWVTDGISSIADTVTQVGTTWTRISCTGTMSGSATEFGLLVALTDSTGNSYATGTWYIWGAQAEAVTYQTTPSTYNPTTTAPYYGPRYDYAYNGTTWDAQGLLVEAAATNNLQYSETFSTAWWTQSGVTLSGPAITAPNGVSTSTRWNTASGYSSVFNQTNLGLTTGTYTYSFFIKPNGTNSVQFWVYDGTSTFLTVDCNGSNGTYTVASGSGIVSSKNVSGGWYRFAITFNAAVNQIGFQTFAATNLYIWGAQLEAGSFPTSYIPNLATGTTTRNADTSLAFSAISLPTGLSFSRASNAMQYDAAGRLTYAPNNLCIQSNSFTTTWTTSSAMVPATTTAVNDPLGGTSAWTFTEDTSSGYHREYQVLTLATGQSYVVSVYLQNIDARYFNFSLYSGPTDYAAAIFDLVSLAATTGASGTGYSVSDGNVVSVGSGWYRCSFKITLGSASVTVSIGLSNSATISSYGLSATYTGTSRKLYVFGAQIETVTYETLPRPYNATTTSAYYGPRYDYDPLTRLPKGLLIEEGRTNIQVYSEQFDNAAWVTAGNASSITANQALAPSGVQTADLLAADGTANQHYIDQNVWPVVSGTQYTLTLYVKKNTANFVHFLVTGANIYAQWNLSTGAVVYSSSGSGTLSTPASGVNVGNGWWRFGITFTQSSNTNQATRIYPLAASQNTAGPSETSTASVYIWGAQLEAGSFPTSYIPNPGIASGIRSADVANVTGANFSSYWNATEGTFYFAGASNTDTGSSAWCFSADDGTLTGNSLYAFCNGAPVTYRIYRSSGLEVDINAGNRSQGVKFKVATGYKANDAAASLNGSAAIADTSVTLPTVDRLNIGRSPSGQFYLNGHIAALKYWRARLSNAKLQTETA